MKIYAVGGAVRDRLLGLPQQDRDYVVVGATPEDMLAQGFTPVGKDFPVFLHPLTHDEYALARTERKTAPGYKGFVFHTAAEVTLEQDLIRRDLTINAMAEAEDGTLADPFGGQQDLRDRVFRHVSDAFAEDPVRILRVARFAARFTDFTVAPETQALMRRMTEAGEVDALVAERVWQELARGLMEKQPSRMFDVLRDCTALARIMPELDRLWRVPNDGGVEMDAGCATMAALDMAALQGLPLPVRTGILLHALGKGETPVAEWPLHPDHETRGVILTDAVCRRLKIPGDCRGLSVMTARESGNVMHAQSLDAEALTCLLERCDAFRKPQRLIDMLHAVGCVVTQRKNAAADAGRSLYLERLLIAAQAVNAGAIAQLHGSQPQQIPLAIHAARVAAVAAASADEIAILADQR